MDNGVGKWLLISILYMLMIYKMLGCLVISLEFESCNDECGEIIK